MRRNNWAFLITLSSCIIGVISLIILFFLIPYVVKIGLDGDIGVLTNIITVYCIASIILKVLITCVVYELGFGKYKNEELVDVEKNIK